MTTHIVTQIPPTPLERITKALDILSSEEANVVALISERMVRGRLQYGEMRPQQDSRNYAKETMEEVADGLVYVAAALARGRW